MSDQDRIYFAMRYSGLGVARGERALFLFGGAARKINPVLIAHRTPLPSGDPHVIRKIAKARIAYLRPNNFSMSPWASLIHVGRP